MIDIAKYKWYIYKGRLVTLVTDHPEFDFQLGPEGKFGYRKIGANHYIVSRADLNIRFKIKAADAERITTNATGWKGKIRGIQVEAGGPVTKPKKAKGSDKYPDENDPNLYILKIDSSNLLRAWVDKKAKELHVVFRNSEAHWLYENVSLALAKQMENADSQGQFFYYRIRGVKPERKISG